MEDENKEKRYNSSNFTNVLNSFANIGVNLCEKIAFDFSKIINSSFISSMNELSKNISEIASAFAKIDFTDFLKGISSEDYLEKYSAMMYETKWFPYTGYNVRLEFCKEIEAIFDSSRVSENRIRRVDACVYRYYNKNNIEQMKRNWRRKKMPKYFYRILQQAVSAYYRKEYAMTSIVLASLWEGIVAKKSNNDNFRTVRKTKSDFKSLVESNDYPQKFSQFYNEYIMYNCMSNSDVKKDVPGRHGMMHGWYNSYPSRKTALNSIIFTDFLLNINTQIRKK